MLARFSAAFSRHSHGASMSTGTSAVTWRGASPSRRLALLDLGELAPRSPACGRHYQLLEHFKMPCFAARSTCSAVAAVAAVGTSICHRCGTAAP